MVFFNYALRKLNAKIVYYGPGLCGKTTNLQWIHDHFEGGKKGNMLSLATEGDRTIFFDLLPLDIGTIRGMNVTLQLYTVPGQVHYNSTRQLVLRGADGVVFVADSQRAMLGSNRDSWRNLKENLLLQGVELGSFPHVLQFNKRDLGDIVSVERLDEELNEYSAPIFEAVATQGIGVQETLEGIVKLVMRNLRERYEAEFARPAAPTGFAAPSVAPAAPAPPAEMPPAQPPAWPVPRPAGAAAAPPPAEEPEASTAPVDYGKGPEAETHPGVAGLSIGSAERGEEEKEPTLVIAPEDTGLPVPDVGEVELDEGALETADLEEESAPLDIDLPESGGPSLELSPEEDVAGPPQVDVEAGDGAAPEDVPDAEAGAVEVSLAPPAFQPRTVVEPEEQASGREEEEEPPAAEAPGPQPELREEHPAAEAAALDGPAGAWQDAESEPREEAGEPGEGTFTAETGVVSEPFEMEATAPAEGVPDAAAGGASREGDHSGGPQEAPFETGGDEAAAAGGAGEEAREEGGPQGADVVLEEPGVEEEPAALAEEPAASVAEPFDLPSEAMGGGPELKEDLFTVEEPAGPELPAPEPAEPELPAPEPAEEQLVAPGAELAEERSMPAAEPCPDSPGTPLWEGDPFELPEEAPPAGETRVLAPVEARAVSGAGGGNQLRLSLEGTGALAEYGQVRELDIVVPVPGDWIGGRKVTLQFRLTLVPEGEAE